MQSTKSLHEKKSSECKCDTCVGMCKTRPCWPTPSEAKAIMDAGLGHKMWMDYWAGGFDKNSDTMIIGPAVKGKEGMPASFAPDGECSFLTENGLCELHDKGLKPIEGRLANCQNMTDDSVHEQVAQEWESEEGEKVASLWEEKIMEDSK